MLRKKLQNQTIYRWNLGLCFFVVSSFLNHPHLKGSVSGLFDRFLLMSSTCIEISRGISLQFGSLVFTFHFSPCRNVSFSFFYCLASPLPFLSTFTYLGWTHTSIYFVCMCVYIYIYTCVCMYVMYVCMHAYMHVCMYLCMHHACMYAYSYV